MRTTFSLAPLRAISHTSAGHEVRSKPLNHKAERIDRKLNEIRLNQRRNHVTQGKDPNQLHLHGATGPRCGGGPDFRQPRRLGWRRHIIATVSWLFWSTTWRRGPSCLSQWTPPRPPLVTRTSPSRKFTRTQQGLPITGGSPRAGRTSTPSWRGLAR